MAVRPAGKEGIRVNEGIEWLEGEDGEWHKGSEGECRSSLMRESGRRELGPEREAGSSGDLALCGTRSCIGGKSGGWFYKRG